MIDPCDKLADIGSDHAWLPIRAIQEKKVKYAYACDVAKGPLQAAKKNIDSLQLQEKITTVLSNGFDNVPKDIQCAVIAGMGCKTAIGILDKCDYLDHLNQILVEVNNDVESFRKWISLQKYTIQKEKVIMDRGHDYICISFNTLPSNGYSEEDCVLGPYLRQHVGEEYLTYCAHKAEKLEFILSKRNASDPTYEELKKRYVLFQNVLKEKK